MLKMTDQTPPAGSRATASEDLVLLKRYAKTGDAEAFQVLVERYENLVWSVCLRVLGNSSDAEDAVQNVFLSLAKKAASVESNLAAWLHTAAVNQSTSQVRSDAARRKREQQHVEHLAAKKEEHEWKDIRELIDVCLAELSEADRELIIQRFYRGMTQAEIGERLGVGQQAVAQRLQEIVERLRRGLRHRGLPVTAATLAGSLAAGLAEASAPVHVVEALAKISIAGVGSASLPAATGLMLAGKWALALSTLVICLVGAWSYLGRSGTELDSVFAQLDTARSIQYTKTRTNSLNAQAELIEPQDVIDTAVQRYYILDGFLERIEELDQDGTVVRTMIANYRTGEVVMIDNQSKTYITNVKLKRQLKELLPRQDLADGLQLAPHTELADYLVQFTPDAAEDLVSQTVDGREVVGLRTETRQGGSVWKRTAWFDRETLRPVSTIETFRNDQPGVGASDWVCDRFVFDAELPRSLFSTDPPAGFKLRQIGESDMQGIPIP